MKSMKTMRELLDEYRGTAAALHARYEALERNFRAAGGGEARSDLCRRLRLVGGMYFDALCTVREIEAYLEG